MLLTCKGCRERTDTARPQHIPTLTQLTHTHTPQFFLPSSLAEQNENFSHLPNFLPSGSLASQPPGPGLLPPQHQFLLSSPHKCVPFPYSCMWGGGGGTDALWGKMDQDLPPLTQPLELGRGPTRRQGVQCNTPPMNTPTNAGHDDWECSIQADFPLLRSAPPPPKKKRPPPLPFCSLSISRGV